MSTQRRWIGTLPDRERALLKEMARRSRLSEAEIVRRLILDMAKRVNLQLPQAVQPGAATAAGAEPAVPPTELAS